MSRIHRIALEQYDTLVTGLLDTPSGGRFPVLLVVATLQALTDFLEADWEIECQGINVADTAAGVGGDITVKKDQRIVLAVEVTERPVDRSRIVATFNEKIAPHGIEDYLFFVKRTNLDEKAMVQARQYFVQGHEVNFLEIGPWIRMVLAAIGTRGRDLFNRKQIELLDDPEVPRAMKVAWNDRIAALVE